jgi:hypothetical protein
MLYTTYVANNFKLNQTPKKKPDSGAGTERKIAMQPEQLSPKTLEFIAKLQKIQDNVLRDISDL